MKFQYLYHMETKLLFEQMELYYRCNVQCNHNSRIIAAISVRYLSQFQMLLVLICHLELIFHLGVSGVQLPSQVYLQCSYLLIQYVQVSLQV